MTFVRIKFDWHKGHLLCWKFLGGLGDFFQEVPQQGVGQRPTTFYPPRFSSPQILPMNLAISMLLTSLLLKNSVPGPTAETGTLTPV